jgi:hypothetical protein
MSRDRLQIVDHADRDPAADLGEAAASSRSGDRRPGGRKRIAGSGALSRRRLSARSLKQLPAPTPSSTRLALMTALFTREPAPTDHGGETTEDRLARRAANWTPATIHR